VTDGVAVEGLIFTYTRATPPAVAGLDLSVAAGEIAAVVGPSGSGKSTLLRLISGLLSPSAGRVMVGGRDVTGVPPERRPVAMVFQGFALFPHLDVASNIGFGLAVRRVPRREREARVREVAARLGLEALLARRPGEISGGERQRVALARALVRDPVAFCLDEPLSSLDAPLRASARRDLHVLLRRDGRCAVYVTHDQAEAMTLADRVAVIRDGRLEQVGTPRELYDHPATAFVASFIGSPPMSLLPAGTAGLDGPTGAVTVGVRAEHVQVVPGDAATVVAVEDLGHERIAELDVGGGVVLARLPRDQDCRRGDRVGLVVDPSDVQGFDDAGRAL
jgi:multiple sugar transport system ATP-binding protein